MVCSCLRAWMTSYALYVIYVGTQWLCGNIRVSDTSNVLKEIPSKPNICAF